MADSNREKNPEEFWEEKPRLEVQTQQVKYRVPSREERLRLNEHSAASLQALTNGMSNVQMDTRLATRAEDLKRRQSVSNPNFSYMGMPLDGVARWFKPGDIVNLCGYTVSCGFFYVGEYFSAANKSFIPGLIRPSRVVQVAKTKFEKDPNKVLATSTFLESEHQIYKGGYENLDATARDVYLQWLANDRMGRLLAPGPLLIFLCGVEKHVLQSNLHNDKAFLTELLPIIEEVERLIDDHGARSWHAIDIAKSLVEVMKALCQLQGVTGFNRRYHMLRGRTTNMSGTGLEERFVVCARVNMDLWQCLQKKKRIPLEVMFELAKSFGLSNGRYLKNPIIQEIILKHWKRVYDTTDQAEQKHLIPKSGKPNDFAVHYESPATQNFRIFAKGYSRTFFSDYQRHCIINMYERVIKDIGYAAEKIMTGDDIASLDVLSALPGAHCWPATPVHLNDVRQQISDPPVSMPASQFFEMLGLQQYLKQTRMGLLHILSRYHIGVVPSLITWSELPPPEVVPYAIPIVDAQTTRPLHRTTTGRDEAISTLIGCLYFLFEKAELTAPEAAPKINKIIYENIGRYDPILFAMVKAEVVYLGSMKTKGAAFLINRIEKYRDYMESYGFVGAMMRFVREHVAYPAIQVPFVVRFLTATNDDEDAAIRIVGHTRESFALLSRKPPKERKKKTQATGADKPVETPSVPFVLSLDHNKVAEIEQETGEVAQLMAGIFAEEDRHHPNQSNHQHHAGAGSGSPATGPNSTGHSTPGQSARAQDPHADQPQLLGLSTVHSKLLATMLAAGDAIPRATYLGFCQSLGLMPESALEAINEAGFEAHGMALFEGEDPLERNPDIAL